LVKLHDVAIWTRVSQKTFPVSIFHTGL
jgi:hypothetical protein